MLGEVLTASVTPFDSDGAVNMTRFRELAGFLVDNGSDGLVVTGSTGESATLTDDERIGALLGRGGHRGRPRDGDRRHRDLRHAPLRPPDEAGARAGRRRLPRRHAVLQQAAAARDRRAREGDRRRYRQADRLLQHPRAGRRPGRASRRSPSWPRFPTSSPSSRPGTTSRTHAGSSRRPACRSTQATTT